MREKTSGPSVASRPSSPNSTVAACGLPGCHSKRARSNHCVKTVSPLAFVSMRGSVSGSPWNVLCPTSKSGTSWHVISAIDGVPVRTLHGVDVLYAAAGLFVPAGAPSLLISHGNRTIDGVALTFDMGGRIGDSLAIMNLLVSRGVQATIFPTGEIVDSAATSAGRQVLQIVQAHPGQFTLGNHSYDHPYFTQLTAAEMAAELRRAETAFAKATSQDPKPYFRPPYGASNSSVLAGVGAAGVGTTGGGCTGAGWVVWGTGMRS